MNDTLSPAEIYQARIADGTLRDDPQQTSTVGLLDALHGALSCVDWAPQKRGLGSFFARKHSVQLPKGLYLWGGVGRGKSMLMDLFFEASTVPNKRRDHFHAFMQSVHDGLAQARAAGIDDPLVHVAQELMGETKLLCFDELQITDITDAMIVGRLFDILFEQGVVLVTTSNRHPDDLYKDGLNRKLFLPFIDLIKAQVEIHHLDSQTDHRQQTLSGQDLFFSPIDDDAQKSVEALWQTLTGGVSEKLLLQNKGREIVINNFGNGVARVKFEDLCAQPLGPSDFLLIAQSVSVLIMEDVPVLGRHKSNEAKRFVTLVDTLYENKTGFICLAQAEPDALYVDGSGAFEFQRTASRLQEMRSGKWEIGDIT